MAVSHLFGTAAGDELTGTTGNDVMSGLAGDDTISGGDGNDVLYGNSGNDVLYGGGGDDVLIGGDGNDSFIEFDGNNVFFGGDGDDSWYVNGMGLPSAAFIDAGTGNDQIAVIQVDAAYVNAGTGDDLVEVVFASQIAIEGGSGNDVIRAWAENGSSTISGGSGDDYIIIEGGSSVIDAGSGDDHITLNGESGVQVVTTGSGSDSLMVTRLTLDEVIVTDFTAGVGGDKLDLSVLTSYLQDFTWPASPFATGHMRAVQSGHDALFQVDVDGAGGPRDYATVVVLENVKATSLTSENLWLGWEPPVVQDSVPNVLV